MAHEGTHPELSQIRGELDSALLGLCELEPEYTSLHALERELAEALRQVYLALGSAADAHAFEAATGHARQQLKAALTRLAGAQPNDRDLLAPCLAQTSRALEGLQSVRFRSGYRALQLPDEPAKEATWLEASSGLPRLLRVPRPTLRPTLVFQEAEPKLEPVVVDVGAPVTGHGDLVALEVLMRQSQASALSLNQPEPEPDSERGQGQAEVPPDGLDQAALEALRFGQCQAESRVGFERARLALDEMGMLAAMRRPDDEDPWTSNHRCEQRMLCRVDAIVAAGAQHLPELIKLLEDRPLADPELSLALCFTLGCLAGDDCLDQIGRLLRMADLQEADLREAAADALSFAPQPGVAGLLAPWLTAEDDSHRALAVEVLGRRRGLSGDQLAAAAGDGSLRVQRAAALALEKFSGPVKAAAVHLLIHHEDAVVATLGLHGAALRNDPRALQRAEALCREGRPAHGQAALICALTGPRASLDALNGLDEAIVFDALGWAGEGQSLERLLTGLESDDADRPTAAALALHRITGLTVTDDAQDVPVAVDSHEAPFHQEFRQPQRAHALSLDPEPWRRHLEPHLSRWSADVRYRHGRPFEAAHALWEVTEASALRCDRRRAHLELRARFGVQEPLDTEHFVALQQGQHERIAAEVADKPRRSEPWHSRLARAQAV